jgi:hypothetical protein
LSADITPENVILRGADARPTPELNQTVVMSQIAKLYPDFLTDEARAILARPGGNLSELPADHNPIHSNFRDSVMRLAVHAMDPASLPAEGASLADRWGAERGRRESIVRGGLPEELLREIVNARLDAWEGVGALHTSAEAMRTKAERLAGERNAYERDIPELMRRIGR